MNLNIHLILKVAALLCIMYVLLKIFDREPKVSKFILYSQPNHAYYESVSFEHLNRVPYKTITDSDTLRIFEKARRSYNFLHIWEAVRYGVLVYENGDSAIIYINRYQGIYKNMKSNKKFIFNNEKDNDNWMRIVDSLEQSIIQEDTAQASNIK